MYKVAIRKNNTGEIRIREIDLEWKDSDYSWWGEDGNMGCDCNRYALFHNEPLADVKCSEGLYSALYAELPDGTRKELDEI